MDGKRVQITTRNNNRIIIFFYFPKTIIIIFDVRNYKYIYIYALHTLPISVRQHQHHQQQNSINIYKITKICFSNKLSEIYTTFPFENLFYYPGLR